MFKRLAIFITVLCALQVSAQTTETTAELPQEAQAQQPAAAIISVNDTKIFRQVTEAAHDVVVAYTRLDTLSAEIQTIFQNLIAKVPAVSVVHIVCNNATKRLCKYMNLDPTTGEMVSEIVVVHYRSGRFNRIIRRTDEASLLEFFANPFANPCDDDPLVSKYSCVNSLQEFTEALKGAEKVVTLFFASWNKLASETRATFTAVATVHAGTAKFVAVDVSLPQTGVIAQAYEINLFPKILVFHTAANAACNVHVFCGNASNTTEVNEWLLSASTPSSLKCDAANLLLQNSASHTSVLSNAAPLTVVTQANYETFINQTATPMLMLIYSTAGPECNAAVTEFQRALTLIQAEALNATLIILDADQSLELVRRWKIANYPTIEYIANGQFEFIAQNELLKTAEEIVAFFRLTDLDRRAFRKLLIKPFLFSSNLKRLDSTATAAHIATVEHAFVMPVFNATVDQDIQLRKAVKELSKAVDQLGALNFTNVDFIVVNCTANAADAFCTPTISKNTTAAFVINYYLNGTLTQQAVAEELIELLPENATNSPFATRKVKSREILQWAANVTGLPLNLDENTQHKQKEALEKASKRSKKEKTVDEAAETGEDEQTKATKAEEKKKAEKTKEDKSKKAKNGKAEL